MRNSCIRVRAVTYQLCINYCVCLSGYSHACMYARCGAYVYTYACLCARVPVCLRDCVCKVFVWVLQCARTRVCMMRVCAKRGVCVYMLCVYLPCACMCVLQRTRMSVYVCTCVLFGNLYARMCLQLYSCMRVCMHAWDAWMCSCTCTLYIGYRYAYMRIYACICGRICAYAYICVCAGIQTLGY